MSVSELRDNLRSVLDSVKAGEVVTVGSHGNPEALLLPADALPSAELSTMLAAVAVSSAHHTFCENAREQKRGDVWHPGDAFGRVLAWLWQNGKVVQAAIMTADLLAEARVHNPNIPEPRIAFSDLLVGVQMSLPHSVGKSTAREIIEYLKEHVPGLYGADTESP